MDCLTLKFSRACEVPYEIAFEVGSCRRHRLPTVPPTPPVVEQGLPRPGSWRLVVRQLVRCSGPDPLETGAPFANTHTHKTKTKTTKQTI